MSLQELATLVERLDRIEAILETLLRQRSVKEWYSTGEVAEILEKAEFTVREWCRLGRVHAEKFTNGRGNKGEWRIAHQELVRIQNEGLLQDRMAHSSRTLY